MQSEMSCAASIRFERGISAELTVPARTPGFERLVAWAGALDAERLFAVEDGNSYIAKMRRGAEGEWLFRSPYTADEQAGVPAFLPYLLLGKMASGRGSHEQLVALFHLARILAIPLMVFSTYRFVSRFVLEVRWRRWATILASAGGGMGWLVFLSGSSSWLGSQPLEMYSPETFGFLAALTFPHLLLARAFLFLGLDAYLESTARPRAAWFAAGWLVLLMLVLGEWSYRRVRHLA